MRVLLISANRSRITVPPFPLGAAYVASAVSAAGHEVRAWDAMFEGDWRSGLREAIRSFGPEAIGISVRNVDDQEMRRPQLLLDEAKDLIDACRESTAATLIAGGPGFGLFPLAALDRLAVEFGIAGEGERAFPELLDRLEAGGDPGDVPGLAWRDEGRPRINPPRPIAVLDSVRPPDRAAFAAARYYGSRGTADIPNSITVQTKRGCDEACIYCSSPVLEGRDIRVRSPHLVVDEVEDLHRRGFGRIQFVDSLFTNPRWHAVAICEEILRRGIEIAWGCTLHPGVADADLLALMRRTGCSIVMVGNESGCSRMLRSLRKGFTKEDVERCFAACEKVGLRYNAFLLLGGPGEDGDSVRESVALMERHAPAQVSVTVGIRLYPGCELARLAEAEGAIPPGADLLEPVFYLAPAVREWIHEFLDPVMRRNPHWTA